MKVIMKADVKKIGKKYEVIDVSTGYANNFLIKNNYAEIATPENMKKLKKILKQNQSQREEELVELNLLKKELESKKYIFNLKLGNNGNVFGKVSTKEIVKKLKEEGFTIDRKKILTDGINHLGDEKVQIQLDKEVIATIEIEIIGA